MKKVKSKELIIYLEEVLKRKPKAKEITEAIELSSAQIYYNRLQRNGFFSDVEIKKIEKYFNIDLSKLPSHLNPSAVEISSFDFEGLNAASNYNAPQSIWLDKKIVRDVWCRHENDLRILQMCGNTMDGGYVPIRNGDTLIVDTTIKNINFTGIFAYTTNNNTALFVSAIELKADGTIKFAYFNPLYKDEIYTKEQLYEMDFKLLGQVIKNMSLNV